MHTNSITQHTKAEHDTSKPLSFFTQPDERSEMSTPFWYWPPLAMISILEYQRYVLPEIEKSLNQYKNSKMNEIAMIESVKQMHQMVQ